MLNNDLLDLASISHLQIKAENTTLLSGMMGFRGVHEDLLSHVSLAARRLHNG